MDATKGFLRQIRKFDILIDNKQKEIERLKSSAYYPKANTMQDTIVKIIEYENELNHDIDNLIDKKLEVKRVVDQLKSADMIDILYKRYFQFETWEQIAADKGYSFQWLHRLHAKALKEIKKILTSDKS